jgi:hypothetical protein
MINECGAVDGMRTDRGSRYVRRKPAPVRLCLAGFQVSSLPGFRKVTSTLEGKLFTEVVRMSA